jgi:hypothetical protein
MIEVPNFVPGIPTGVTLNEVATAIHSAFETSWMKVQKPLEAPEAERARLTEAYAACIDHKKLLAGADALNQLDRNLVALKIETFEKLLPLLETVAETFPPAVEKSLAASYKAIVDRNVTRKKEFRAELEARGAEPLYPNQGGDPLTGTLMLDKEVKAASDLQGVLSAFRGTFRTDGIVANIKAEFDEITAQIAKLRRSLLIVW